MPEDTVIHGLEIDFTDLHILRSALSTFAALQVPEIRSAAVALQATRTQEEGKEIADRAIRLRELFLSPAEREAEEAAFAAMDDRRTGVVEI